MNGIIYESTDSWWVRHGGTVGCALAFVGIFVAFALGMMYP